MPCTEHIKDHINSLIFVTCAYLRNLHLFSYYKQCYDKIDFKLKEKKFLLYKIIIYYKNMLRV